jgi:hypothetical protein
VSSTLSSHSTSPTALAPGLSVRQEAIPGAVAPPAVEAIEAGLPGAIPFRQVAPGRAGAQLPEDTVDDGGVVSPLASALAVLGQERLDLSPGRSVISLRLTVTFSPVVALFSDYGITQTRVSRQTCPRELEGFWLAPTAQAVDLCVRPAPHQRSPRWSLARRSYRTSRMCA